MERNIAPAQFWLPVKFASDRDTLVHAVNSKIYIAYPFWKCWKHRLP